MAISQSLEIQLGVAAVLFVLARALPRRPRDLEAAEAGPATAKEEELKVPSRSGL